MTLDTRIYVLDPIGHREVFAECQRLLATYDEQDRTTDAQVWRDEKSEYSGHWTIANKLGQGLPALLEVDYQNGAPLRTAEDQAAHEPDLCDDDCTSDHAYRTACWLEVSFDTAYSAVSKGLRCSELHVRLIVGLGRWLDQQGLRWKWMNEYSGEVFERFDGLTSLIGDGDQAMAWFDREVVPALPAIVAQREDGGQS